MNLGAPYYNAAGLIHCVHDYMIFDDVYPRLSGCLARETPGVKNLE